MAWGPPVPGRGGGVKGDRVTGLGHGGSGSWFKGSQREGEWREEVWDSRGRVQRGLWGG